MVSFLYCLARLWVCLRMVGRASFISGKAMGQVVMSRYSLLPCLDCFELDTKPMLEIFPL